MRELLLAPLLAFVVALLLGPLLLPVLRRLKFGQTIRQEGPERHYAKAGTPTMGGIIILLALSAAAFFFGRSAELYVALGVTLSHGLLGFADDFTKVVLKRSLGLRAREKIFWQMIIAAALAYAATMLGRGTDIWIPLIDRQLELGIWYYPFVFLVVIGSTNAVNLTDGLDGLAAGTVAVAAVVYSVVCLAFAKDQLALFSAILAGACLGFVKYNLYPAKVFMGDTGSLALGAALAAVAVLTKTELLLAIVGGVFVVEALSVIIQVFSFKTTGRRVFRMSPLHHHFELLGWPETKVVFSFWLAGAICGLLTLLIVAASGTGGMVFGF